MASWEKEKELAHLHQPEDDPLPDLSLLLDMDQFEPTEGPDSNPGAEKIYLQLQVAPGDPSEKTYKFGYEDKEAQNPDLKMRNWVPDPEKMSKWACARLILCGLYNAKKAKELLKMDYDIHWEQSKEDSQYFEIEYHCKMCMTVIHEPMPVSYDKKTGLWIKMGPLRGDIGSVVHTCRRHYERCMSALPSSGEPLKPRVRANPVRRYREKSLIVADRPKRSRWGVAPREQPNTSSGDAMALMPGPCGPFNMDPPGCLLERVPGSEPGTSEMALAMSGGPFWEQVYRDSISGPPTGPSEN
ncbi:Tas [African green monkey simian foamy virus]|uniref:Protein Bel-1 n=1 Tax=Simian foamy virus type 3 (strain LK3) TaxID=11644 RepID=BEL1_SFV3L|nr:Tas [African green monkey simian foamy virus]P27402.1 RecName: Full=Protein Bel-1; AltName: Full=Transactivator of spumavirus; Short=Tas; AltName: Full=Transcriptional transactivator [Simian foamy virus (TYPE 3 / STRAIN LK3)]pir/WMLJLK/ bel-1 protein - simian foamy virus (type 3, strain LK3) [Simian foamy virus]